MVRSALIAIRPDSELNRDTSMGLVCNEGLECMGAAPQSIGGSMNFKYAHIKDGEYKYKLVRPYSYNTIIKPIYPRKSDNVRLELDGTLYLSQGFQWDGATGAIDKVKHVLGIGIREKIIRASCIHDALCNLIKDGELNIIYRKIADDIFREICKEDGMSWIRRQWTYYAIRGFVKMKYGWGY